MSWKQKAKTVAAACALIGLGAFWGVNRPADYDVAVQNSKHIQQAEKIVTKDLPKVMQDNVFHTREEFDATYRLLRSIDDHLQKSNVNWPDRELQGLLLHMSMLHNAIEKTRDLSHSLTTIMPEIQHLVATHDVRTQGNILSSLYRIEGFNELSNSILNNRAQINIQNSLWRIHQMGWEVSFLEPKDYEKFSNQLSELNTVLVEVQRKTSHNREHVLKIRRNTESLQKNVESTIDLIKRF